MLENFCIAMENWIRNHNLLTIIIICISIYIPYKISCWIACQEELIKTDDETKLFRKLYNIRHPILVKKKKDRDMEYMLKLAHIEHMFKIKHNIFITYELKYKEPYDRDLDVYLITLYNVDTSEVILSGEKKKIYILETLNRILDTCEALKVGNNNARVQTEYNSVFD